MDNQQLVECKVKFRLEKVYDNLLTRFASGEISRKHFTSWIWYLECKFGFLCYEDYHTPSWIWAVLNRLWTWEKLGVLPSEQFDNDLTSFCEGLVEGMGLEYSEMEKRSITSSSSETIFLHPSPENYAFKTPVVVKI